MAMEMRQQLKMTQQLVMTPQLQQAIKLLQLTRLELQDRGASGTGGEPAPGGTLEARTIREPEPWSWPEKEDEPDSG